MRVSGCLLDQFKKNAVRSGGVNKSYQGAACAHARAFVNQARALLSESRQRRVYVWDAHGYVMNAGASFLQKFCYRRIVARRLQKLHAGFAQGKHSHAHLLLSDLFRLDNLKPQRVAPEPERVVERARGDADVFDLHNQWSVVSGRWSVVELLASGFITDH